MALRRSIYLSLFSQWTGVVLAFVTTVFVSRLLTPREVGVFAISIAVVGLVGILQNFGVKEFIVQSKALDLETRRAAFGVSILAGLATSLLIILASWPAAAFYGAPELKPVMWVLAINPALNMLAAPIGSMLWRDRMFHKLSAINVAAAAANTATAVTLAFFGFSYMSLALGLLASSIVTLSGQQILGSQFSLWRPKFVGIKVLLSFGMKVHLANVFSFIQFQTTELIIGKALGLSAAAMFHRSTIVSQMFNKLVTQSLQPVLTAEYAALNRTGGRVAASFVASMGYLSAVAWPFFAFMALYAHEVILVLFGDQWTAAIVPMQFLCIAAAFWPMNGPAMGVLVGVGAVNLNLILRAATMIVRLGLTIIAALYSLQAVALAVVASAAFTFVATTLGARYKAPFTMREVGASLAPSIMVSVLAILPAALVQWVLRDYGMANLVVLVLGIVAGGLGWLLGLRVIGHPLWNEATLFIRRGADVLIPPVRRRATLPRSE